VIRLNHRNTKNTETLGQYLRDLCVSVVHFLFPCLLVAILLLLSACEPTATPFPVDIPPTPTTTPVRGAPPTQIRYALAANAAGFVPDLNLIAASGSIEQLTEAPNPSDIGERFDLIAAYGKWPEATESPVLPHVALVINTTLPPFDDPAVINVVRRAIDPAAILAVLEIPGVEASPLETAASVILRTELANAGWPDGFDVILAYRPIPGIAEMTRQLASIGLIGQPIALSNSPWERTHIAIITWAATEEHAAWVERAGDENVIDLFTLPISYWAAPDLSITFTPGGWPLATRP
jgi:hypothetical protein